MFSTMSTTYEQIANVNKANMEVFSTMARAALAGSERLAGLNLEAARRLLDAGADNANVLFDATALRDPIAAQKRLVQPSYEQIAAYSRGLYEIVAEMQNTMSAAMTERIADANGKATSAMAQVTGAAVGAAKIRKAA